MIDECERACDEDVLDAGCDAQDYAEGILNVCKFYVEPLMECVSDVTGSDLKETDYAHLIPARIRRIPSPPTLPHTLKV
jgi:hypothetical protein